MISLLLKICLHKNIWRGIYKYKLTVLIIEFGSHVSFIYFFLRSLYSGVSTVNIFSLYSKNIKMFT